MNNTNIIITNPSVNLSLIGSELTKLGVDIEYVTTTGLPIIQPERVFYFYDNKITCYSEKDASLQEKVPLVMNISHGLRARFDMLKFTDKLIDINPCLASGGIRDYAQVKLGAVKYAKRDDSLKSFTNVKEVSKAYPDSRILTSATSESSNVKLYYWETDLDLSVTLGNDYFVAFNEKTKVEAFVLGGLLVTASKQERVIDALSDVIPTLKKFSFKKQKEQSITVNRRPWLVKEYSNTYLVNDYSYGLTSTNMPSSWHEKVATHIISDKLFGKKKKH